MGYGNYSPGDMPGRPLNYDELVIKQLDTIAEDIRGEDPIRRTIVNVLMLSIFTRVDNHDDEVYKKALVDIGIENNRYLNRNLIDLRTGKPKDDIETKVAFEGSIKKMAAIMDCLIRKGRFPSKFSVEDDDFDSGEGKPIEGSENELHTTQPADDDKVAYPQE